MSTPRPIALPTLHTNGTSSRMLLEGYVEASLALGEAISKVAAIEFNARDYYPQGDGAWEEARKQFVARLHALSAVRGELDAITEHILDTKGNR